MSTPYPPWHPRLESMADFVARAGEADGVTGGGLTVNWHRWLHGDPDCDCPLSPHHRWNCPLTPIWAQTIRAGYLPTMEIGSNPKETRDA